jgi:hypothetical protein
MPYADSVKDLLDLLSEGTRHLMKAVAFVKEAGVDYMDLFGRQLVDMAIALINGYLLCGQASSPVAMDVPTADSTPNGSPKTVPITQRKEMMARRYITRNAVKIRALADEIGSGDKSTFKEFEVLAGPVPELG